MMRARRLFVLVLVLLAPGGTAAVAFWTATGSTSASASVGTLNAPTDAGASAARGSSTAHVTWTASTAASGLLPGGYYILRRASGGGTSAACGSSPTSLVHGTACSDTAVADGSHAYRVVASYASWTAASTPSSAVTIASDNTAPALTLTSPADGSATNSTTPTLGGAAGDAAGDSSTVTVRIYNGTGTGGTVDKTLHVTRSGATWSTSATLAQGTYTVQATQADAAANVATSSASTFTVDTTAPALTALRMFDVNADGKIDQVKATFGETLAPSVATSPWTLTGIPSNASLEAVSTSGAVATLALTPGGGAADTAAGSFTIALAAKTGGIRDSVGNEASFTATAPADLAAPVLMTVSANDHGGNGGIGRMQSSDTFVMTFSEALAPRSVPNPVTVTESRSATNISTLTIPGLIKSATIDNSYVRNAPGSGSSSNTAVVLSTRTLTATIASIADANSGLGKGTGPAQIVPAAGLTDLVGNAAATTPQSTGAGSPLF